MDTQSLQRRLEQLLAARPFLNNGTDSTVAQTGNARSDANVSRLRKLAGRLFVHLVEPRLRLLADLLGNAQYSRETGCQGRVRFDTAHSGLSAVELQIGIEFDDDGDASLICQPSLHAHDFIPRQSDHVIGHRFQPNEPNNRDLEQFLDDYFVAFIEKLIALEQKSRHESQRHFCPVCGVIPRPEEARHETFHGRTYTVCHDCQLLLRTCPDRYLKPR